MFLDDELLEMCRNANCETADGIKDLNEALCRKCEAYLKERLLISTCDRDTKGILDRTFNLWDSFTRSAIKEGGTMKILGEFFQEYNYKKQLLKNDVIAEIYNKL